MPLYDCGERECDECQRAFGPNREKAIQRFEAREAFYATLPQEQLTGGNAPLRAYSVSSQKGNTPC